MFLPLLLVLLFIVLLHYYLTNRYAYWLNRNVPYPKPSLFFGNNRNVAMLKTTVGENLQRIYKIYEGYPFVGIYELVTPVLLLRDLKLIKHILVKDFVYFQSKLLKNIFLVIFNVFHLCPIVYMKIFLFKIFPYCYLSVYYDVL
jgi:cytochrome P450 family 6